MKPHKLPSRFRFLAELGGGGFGVVVKAVDRVTGATVAVKLIHRTDANSRRRFVRELAILRSQRDNIFVVDVYDYDGGEQPFLVMEFCVHGSLRARVGQVDWREACAILAHATRGLHGIHHAGGFHRDIKPDNLLVTEVGGARIVKVADFGVARLPEPGGSPLTRSACGTREYLPPEVIAGHPFTAAGDIYALGVTMLELITGWPSPAALSLVRDAPVPFVQFVAQMVHVDPARRPSILDVVARTRALLTCARGLPPIARASRSLLGVMGAGGLLLVAFAALAARDH